MYIKSVILALISGILLSGCSSVIYRPDINQGNYLAPGMAQSVTKGMTQEQVRYLLGSPITQDIFNGNTWIYIFRQEPTRQALTQEMLVVTFDQNSTVSNIEYRPVTELKK